jgi:hypothetical protein
MTSSGGAVPQDLAARLFRALYDDYDLHTIGDLPSARTTRRQSKFPVRRPGPRFTRH